jgi:CRP-like cAMP-binding protein
VVALTDVLLLELDRSLFARLFEEYPEVARQLSAQLARRRSQLRAVASAGGPTPEDSAPEASRIFGRLRQIFRLGE